jgi:hypothetical protein
MENLALVLALFDSLGLQVNMEKSVLIPAQIIIFLGIEVDSLTMTFRVPRDKAVKIVKEIEKLRKQAEASPRELAGLMGKLNAISIAFLPARQHYNYLNEWKSKCLETTHWDHRTILPAPVLQELEWWINNFALWNGRTIIAQQYQAQLFTDASDTGWGAALAGLQAKGHWSINEAAESINWRELTAVGLALQSFIMELQGKVVQVQSDNMVVVSYINKMGGKYSSLWKIASGIWDLALEYKIVLQAEHIRGIYNIAADRLSRTVDRHDWQLDPAIFLWLDQIWGPHDVDLFASYQNTQLDAYFSWMHDPHSSGSDAFQQDWSQLNGFANAPFLLIGRILHKVRRERATITLIAPIWVGAPWFPDLLDLSCDHPRLLPPWKQCFFPSSEHSQVPLNNPKWKAAAWRVSGVPCNKEDWHFKPLL